VPGSAHASASPRLSATLLSRWDVLLVIAVGGALGSLARWGVGELVPWSGTGFPWGTFAANVSGSFALGVLMVLLLEVWPPRRYLRPFLGVGVLGGYTTFSTAMLEGRDLLAGGHAVTAAFYLAASLAVGLAAVALGIVLARLAVRPGPGGRSST
jgi:CrcB protein